MEEIRLKDKQRNHIQVAYFHKLWVQYKDLPLHERFAMAIVYSSDRAFEKALRERPSEITRYIKKHCKRGKKDERDNGHPDP